MYVFLLVMFMRFFSVSISFRSDICPASCVPTPAEEAVGGRVHCGLAAVEVEGLDDLGFPHDPAPDKR